MKPMGISASCNATRFLSGLVPVTVLLISPLLLASCASAPQVYGLGAAPASARVARGNISVDVPIIAPPFDTDLVVVRESADRFARLPDARWADRLPYLVRSRTIETLQNAGLSPGVEPSAASLVLSVRRFEIDATGGVARVEIAAQVVTASGRVLAAKLFSAAEPVGVIAAPDAVQALDRAFGRILPQLVAWAARAAG